jgi:hypothetical protein
LLYDFGSKSDSAIRGIDIAIRHNAVGAEKCGQGGCYGGFPGSAFATGYGYGHDEPSWPGLL